VDFRSIRPLMIRRIRRIIPVSARAGIYLFGLVVVLLVIVLPYWLWSKSDPITQVPIPHASRDSFIKNTSAGLVFFLIPWGMACFALPYAFYKGLSTRAWPLALSLGLLFVLGTGGTTPIPKLLLRAAFNILTPDRFTFWATIAVLPLLGEMVLSLRHGGIARYVREGLGTPMPITLQTTLLLLYLLCSLFAANFAQFRQFQPPSIDMAPIVSFLDKDQHARWRYLTLGFGDQMAWLAAQTTATTVDGDYNSARSLPELTSTPVERLEGAKYAGIPGIGSLQQFLVVPEKYNLKFIFSNDQFYDPLLFFSGWNRLQRLENGIVVWDREDIPPLPDVLPRRDIPVYQRVMWGTFPLGAIFAAILAMLSPMLVPAFVGLARLLGLQPLARFCKRVTARWWAALTRPPRAVWRAVDRWLWKKSQPRALNDEPRVRWEFWRELFRRMPRPRPAPAQTRRLRSAALLATIALAIAAGGYKKFHATIDPVTTVLGYYDDLDFRRFSAAYGRLDPLVRPSYDQYLLNLSVQNGLLASYSKLDSVRARILSEDHGVAVVEADTNWITSLAEYPEQTKLTLVLRQGAWYIQPADDTAPVAPDEFFHEPAVDWHVQGRRVVTIGTTAFGDILDRPVLRVLSTRLVQVNGRTSAVGEVLNDDVSPADVTITAILYDRGGNSLTSYDAQQVIMHKLLPREMTPFRVDFEGVAGASLTAGEVSGSFNPGLFSPIDLTSKVAAYSVYARAVVTDQDLLRDVAILDTRVGRQADGLFHITGNLRNAGTIEATVPHVLATLYDAQGHVAWVDSVYVNQSIRPESVEPFDITLTPAANVRHYDVPGQAFANTASTGNMATPAEGLQPLPGATGYASMRLSVNYFAAGAL
jgi:hypothetical protein